MARLIAERSDIIPLLAEVFRTYGFEGASIARITEVTKLGKGSIYHFFPGGKDEMASVVLDEIDNWFRVNVFKPLREDPDAWHGIAHMFTQVQQYFLSGNRVCLVGAFALGGERDRFASQVKAYFSEWDAALASALVRAGQSPEAAKALSKETLGGIQGALVLARGLEKPDIFEATLKRLQERLRGE